MKFLGASLEAAGGELRNGLSHSGRMMIMQHVAWP